MFEKLLSLLPYNPGLTQQMAFYSRRMREEAVIRRTGMIFLVLAFMIQFFAVISPPQSTVADSSNDLVNGGISSAADAKSHCVNNVRHFKDILNYYGISCAKVGNAATITLSSTSHDGHLYSMGWNPQGQTNNNTNRPTHEQPVNIPGTGKPVYWRLLHSWDSYASSSYKALQFTNNQGHTFYILFNCGNLVAIGIPPPPSEPCPYNANLSADSPQCFKPCQYNHNLPANSPLCFAHCPVPGKTNLAQNSPDCFEPCPYDHSLPANSPKCFEPCKYNNKIPANSPDCFEPCQYNSTIASSSPDCKPCDKSTGSADSLACLLPHKTAGNVTTGASDANGTTANGGDVINYTLSVTNNGKADVKGFVFSENLNDVLDYADVTDLHGGTIDSEGQVTWPAEVIAAGKTVKHEITVKVKNPVPQTPASSSDPNHFDLTMTNVYGNSISIKLPGSPTKTIEAASTSLPNTGPGSTLAVIGFTVLLAGYFYSRSRLLAKESTFALQDMANA